MDLGAKLGGLDLSSVVSVDKAKMKARVSSFKKIWSSKMSDFVDAAQRIIESSDEDEKEESSSSGGEEGEGGKTGDSTCEEGFGPFFITLQSSTEFDEEEESAIQELDPKYYLDGYNAVEDLIGRLPDSPLVEHEQELEQELRTKELALHAVGAKMSTKMLEINDDLMEKLEKIAALEAELNATAETCRSGRSALGKAEHHLVTGGLAVLSKFNKKQMLTEVTNLLAKMQVVVEYEVNMRRAADSDDYSAALLACLELKQHANRFRHITAMRLLSNQAEDTYKRVQDNVEAGLKQMCRSFDAARYQRLLHAYDVMKKMPYVVFKLPQYFEDAVKLITQHAVLKYLPKNLHESRVKFREVCSGLGEDSIEPCLRHMCDQLVELLLSHKAMLACLQSQTFRGSRGGAQVGDVEVGLERCQQAVWDLMQRKVSQFLTAVNISTLKIEQFLQIFDIVNQLLVCGDEFCTTDSHVLRKCIKALAKAYFDLFHRDTLDTIRTMVMNETWQRSPVPIGFNITYIKELRRSVQSAHVLPRSVSSVSASSSASARSEVVPSSAGYLARRCNPFRITEPNPPAQQEGDSAQDMVAAEEDSGPEEIPMGRTADGFDTVAGPVVVPSSLRVIRTVGRYVSIGEVIPAIAPDALAAVTGLVDLYIYTVFSKFALSPTHTTQLTDWFLFAPISIALRSLLVRLRQQYASRTSASAQGDDAKMLGDERLTSAQTMFGIAVRSVAIESLMFLMKVMHTLKSRLQASMGRGEEGAVARYMAETVDVVPELRHHMYLNICTRFLKLDSCMNMVLAVKWDSKDADDFPPQSPYVKAIANEVRQVMERACSIEYGSVPVEARGALWDASITHALDSLVDALSRIKKIGPHAQQQMSRDLQVLVAALEAHSARRPIPRVAYVQNFINAFSLTEDHVLDWVLAHDEYDKRLVVALVKNILAVHMKKKTRDDILQKIDDMQRPHPPSHTGDTSCGMSPTLQTPR